MSDESIKSKIERLKALTEVRDVVRESDGVLAKVSEVLAERDATIARLTAEVGTFEAMMKDCEVEGDKARAGLSELRERVAAAVDYLESDHDLNTRQEVVAHAHALLSPTPEGRRARHFRGGRMLPREKQKAKNRAKKRAVYRGKR